MFPMKSHFSLQRFLRFRNLLCFIPLLICFNSYAQQAQKSSYFLSEAGAISDADLSEGSTVFGSDNTAVIQKILDIALKQPVTIYWDGKYSVTGLKVHSNTTIIVSQGCGAILRNNSNTSLLENSNFSFKSYTTRNIAIYGGIWNGNGFNDQLNPAQEHDLPTQGWISTFKFFGVEGLVIRDATIYRPRTFTVHAAMVKNVQIENVKVDVGASAPINCDGFHFNGPAANITIKDCDIRAKDDHIAFNADDLLDEHASNKGKFHEGIYGDITNVTVENIRLGGGLFGVRLLSGKSRIDNVVVRNIQGTTTGYWLIVDNYWGQPRGDGNFGTLLFENIMVESFESMGKYINSSYANINANADCIIFRNVIRNDFIEDNQPSILISGAKTKIKKLIIDNYQSNKSDKWPAKITPHIMVRDADVDFLSITNSSVTNTPDDGEAPLLKINEKGTVKTLQMNTLYATNMPSIVESKGVLSHVAASNIIHTTPQNLLGTFEIAKDISQFVLSNYSGAKPLSGKGNVKSKKGDAFVK